MVIILFLTGTISAYLAHKGEGHFAYDFKLLSGAAGLIYGYTGLIPLALWGTLKWFGSESANLLECLALYGYANLIWIPVALISWSPIQRKLRLLFWILPLPISWLIPQAAVRVLAIIYIPANAITVLNYIFVGVGLAFSVFFLLRNLYPVLSATDVKTSKILLIVVFALHAGLALSIKILFFAKGSPVSNVGDDAGKGKEGGGDGDKGEKLVRMVFGM